MRNLQRLDSLDALRGLAILTMVCANAAAYLATPHPLGFRYYGSFAAPTFITLSGFFVAYGAQKSGGLHGLKDTLLRAALILAVAAFVDVVCYGLMPFVQVDVLYLIGAGTPLAFLAARLRKHQAFALALAAAAIAPLLRNLLGFVENPIGISFLGTVYKWPEGAAIWKHWLVDGWFPFFPWLGFLFFGVALQKQVADHPGWLATNACRRIGLALALLGAIVGWLRPSPMLLRDGYSEVFYPATTSFLLLAAGVILGFAWLTAVTAQARAWEIARGLGRASLFFYVLHLLVITYVHRALFQPMPLPTYLATYLVFIGALILVSRGLSRVKATQPWTRSYFGKFFLGT